ncbi:cobyrinate a,c-diamide synthase [Pyramidobacter sp. CG50-2]|uniref:cobyrinate a,c-diamide synthase n=1 Tax=Pyramidobacter sp. CG50-2 TaxID=2382160 RepID=UPI000EA1289C|nr:cobyrinate a,c-diamide synthase [Pyramidobacter sp. CG50-2]RKJ79620.1 cobyrinate a,c-diamide synthase [Pyramidobacter sp. CG50-2]
MSALKKFSRLVIAATQSGCGKTTLTCSILAALKKRGLAVQACKIGPDYIDPGYLAQASGRPAHNLDTWLMDEAAMERLFAENSSQADLAVVEGVMGLYDGGRGGVSSTAEIAKKLRAPVALVIDCKSMGDSAAALALGFREYDRGVDFCGVILNRLGSDAHRDMIAAAMDRLGIPVLGALKRDERFAVSERHLGLLPAEESGEHDFDALVECVERSVDLETLLRIAAEAPALEFSPRPVPPAADRRAVIGVARDKAFSFYYPESLAELEHAGARLVFFSPLDDKEPPDADGLIFGGGFPEMFAARLAANDAMKSGLAAAARAGMPIYAECGGYMYLTRSLTDFEGRAFAMAGLIPAACRMNPKLQTVGYVEATALRDTVLCPAGTVVRGHEFHFSSVQPDEGTEASAAWRFVKKRTGAAYAAGYASANVLASYLHLHFAGSPQLARNFVDACERFARSR